MAANEQTKPELKFLDETRKTELEPWCRKVIESLELPNRSTACIFDDRERQEFINNPELGSLFCGFFRPVRDCAIGLAPWPPEVRNQIWKKDDWAFDSVIYLRHRTCQSVVGTVITLAHELTHVRQYGFRYKVYRAVDCVKAVYRGPDLAPWCLPTEYQAQRISKRVASSILGNDEVTAYANKQIKQRFDPAKWEFFLGLDTQQTFCLTKQVDGWVREYRAALVERFHKAPANEPDFAKDNWWV